MKFGIERSRTIGLIEPLPVIGRPARQTYDRWLGLKYDLYWNYLRNPPSRRRFLSQRPQLSPVQQRLVSDLKARGIAFTTFDELIGDTRQWERLSEEVRRFAASEEVAAGLERYRRTLDEVQVEDYVAGRIAPAQAKILNGYWITLYPEDETTTVTSDDPWMRFALAPRVLDVVNEYFGLWSKLIYYDLWHSVQVPAERARFGAQRWHRDPEDRKKLRIYMYFSEVDRGSGPLQYIPGTASGSPHENYSGWNGPVGMKRPPEDEVEQRFPAEKWVTCTGSPGTIIFCDTFGIHRGGVSTSGSRVLATWSFVTPASLHGHRFRLEGSFDSLSPAARYAVR